MAKKDGNHRQPKGLAMQNMTNKHPKFAVVGHPNKGKSSIVASLAQDDSIKISDTPGTTTQSRSLPLEVDGEILYELYDTPGFQRPREVLEWLRSHDVPAHKRADVVREFINQHKNSDRFHDEIELLRPIMDGAGILYVVDGSKPYGVEYEAEMEILRWCMQPSMALINHIGKSDYSSEWRAALGQYFRIVKSYNPMNSDPRQQFELLEAMVQLDENWREPLQRSIKLFKKLREQRVWQSKDVIVAEIVESLRLKERLSIKGESASDAQKANLENRYKNHLREIETRAQHQIEKLWHHTHLQKEIAPQPLNDLDLFSQESASIFGLTRKEMVMTGMLTGAAAGAGIDLLFAGHTLLLGGLIGGAVGAVGAYVGFDELSEMRVLGQQIGSRYLEIGPMQNRNFPYILLGRALYYLHALTQRSHAKRDKLALDMDSDFKDRWLDDETAKALEKQFKMLRSDNGSIDTKELDELILKCITKVVTL